MSASDVIARLRELRAKATAGPWEVDTFSVLDDFGVYSAHAVFDPKGKVLLDTSNSEIQVIHDDRDGEGGSRWDETGRRDLTAIVAAMNSLDALLECAEALETVRGCGVLPISVGRIVDTALQALAEGGGE